MYKDERGFVGTQYARQSKLDLNFDCRQHAPSKNTVYVLSNPDS